MSEAGSRAGDRDGDGRREEARERAGETRDESIEPTLELGASEFVDDGASGSARGEQRDAEHTEALEVERTEAHGATRGADDGATRDEDDGATRDDGHAEATAATLDPEGTLALTPEAEGARADAGATDDLEATLALDSEQPSEAFAATVEVDPPSGDSVLEPPSGESATVAVARAARPTEGDALLIPDLSIEGLLGQGGQGKVYRGRQTYLDREVAVKVLAGGTGSGFARRFQREAKILAGMQHPHIVGCYQAGVDPAGQCFIVMEYISGPDLARFVRESGALSVQDALRLVRDVARALGHASESSVIHRDVKPQNVLLQPLEGAPSKRFPFTPKLADLGLARMTQAEDEMELTAPGSVMGTPSTMALEQFDDPDQVDFRADIYGLGCVLFHCLAGRPAYSGRSMSEIFKQKATQPAPRVRERAPAVPAGVDRLVAKMMASRAEDRFQSYGELIEALEEELARPSDAPAEEEAPTRRVGLWLGLVGLVAIAAGWALSQRGGDSGPDETVGGGASGIVDGDRADGPTASGSDANGPRGARATDSETRDGAAGGESEGGSSGGANDEGGGAQRNESEPGVAGPNDAGPNDTPAPGGTPAEAGSESDASTALPPLEAGERLALFDPTDLLAGWTTEGEAWAPWDSRPGVPQFQGEGAGHAERALPSGAWTLTGALRAFPPFGWDEAEVHAGLRLVFAEGRALELRAVSLGSGTTFEWRYLPADGETPPVGLELPRSTFDGRYRRPVPFRVDLVERSTLLQIGDERPVRLPSDVQQRLDGAPRAMQLVASGGLARFENFELVGE